MDPTVSVRGRRQGQPGAPPAEARDASGTGDSPLCFCARAAAFALGLALVIAALAPLGGLADVPVVGAKLDHFGRRVQDYDTVFVGSSTVYRGISPAVYDAELARRGIAARSFNFGVLGMVPPESYYLLDRILAVPSARIRTVYLELALFQRRAKREHTRRFDYWHSPGHTLDALRVAARSPATWTWKLRQATIQLESFARRTFQVGRGRALGRALVAPLWPPSFDAGILGPDLDGWLSTEDDDSNRMELRRDELAAGEDDLEREVERLRAGAAKRNESPVGLAALSAAVARVRSAGATPILLVPPSLDLRAALIEYARTRIGVEVMAFNDPDRYPELYSAANRFDLGHVNEAGAAHFSRALSARFAELGGG